MALTLAGQILVGGLVAGGIIALLRSRKPRADVPTQAVPQWHENPFGRLGFALGLASFFGYNYVWNHDVGTADTNQTLGTFAEAPPANDTVDVAQSDFGSGGDIG